MREVTIQIMGRELSILDGFSLKYIIVFLFCHMHIPNFLNQNISVVALAKI